jgi:hypothetical protein
MRAFISYWGVSADCKESGYEKGQEIPEAGISKVVMEIFAKGLNVMLFHSSGNCYICINKGKFRQMG